MALDQKTRNKVALALTIVLVPVMILMFVTNIRKAKEKRNKLSDSSQTGAVQPVDLVIPVPPRPAVGRIENKLDVHTVDAQRRIADAQPKCSPFSASRGPETRVSQPQLPVDMKPLRLTGIVQRVSGEQCMAIINGKAYKEGDHVDGWKIAKINKNSVVLDNGEKQVTLDVK